MAEQKSESPNPDEPTGPREPIDHSNDGGTGNAPVNPPSGESDSASGQSADDSGNPVENDGQQSIDSILKGWEFDPVGVNVRKVSAGDREVLQMRVDMGLLQLEVTGRPDASRPNGFATYFEYLKGLPEAADEDFQLSEQQCVEIDREFVQFYHRRICWLQLKEFERAMRDADHTLGLMDFAKVHSPDEQWTISHEQYRPFVIYHRTKAAALNDLEIEDGAEAAIEQINLGLDQMSVLFDEYDATEQFENDELVQRLTEFRETLREKYAVGRTLKEQLADAIETEQYELAAELRDLLDRRDSR